MQTARVLGHATATVRHDSLKGWKLVVLQPLDIHDQPDEFPQLAIDPLGARQGDHVFFTSDTKYIHQLTGRRDTPIRFSVQGILDRQPERSILNDSGGM
ncbi:MAG: EutN/CcmL family microcompartment protein [Planctomycetaceae bacterium]